MEATFQFLARLLTSVQMSTWNAMDYIHSLVIHFEVFQSKIVGKPKNITET